jgi:hypothetical protein
LLRALTEADAVGNVERLSYYRHSNQRRTNWKRLMRRRNLVIFEQCQWSFLTANLTEFLDDLRRHDHDFAAAMKAAERAAGR